MTLWPHHRRANRLTLATHSGARYPQDSRANIQSPSWDCTEVSGTSRSCCWSAWSTGSSLCQHQSSGGSTLQTFNYIGSRAFPVAGPHLWNTWSAYSLVEWFVRRTYTSASSLLTFRKRLKTYLFRQSFPHLDLVHWFYFVFVFIVDLAVTCILRPLYKLLFELNWIEQWKKW